MDSSFEGSEIQKISNVSSPSQSMIEQSNLTTKYYEERSSHKISDYCLENSDIFDTENMKMYENPSDLLPTPKLTIKQVQNLKTKFSQFQSKQPKKERSPKPITKCPLIRKKSENKSISALIPVVSLPSYKKPLLTITLEILGKTINEDVFQGDNSFEIAKRIFIQAGQQASQNAIKALSDVIQKAVTDYMTEVSHELAKFHQNSKKILQVREKSKFIKFKPPLLETERRADEKRQVLGSVEVNIDEEAIIIVVKEGDSPEKLTEKVCNEKGISKEAAPLILQKLRDFVDKTNKKFLFRLEFDISGKNVDVAVYEDDDLSLVAQKFVRENKLGRENISRIEDLLKKQKKTICL